MTAYGIHDLSETIQDLLKLNADNLVLWKKIVDLVTTGWRQYQTVSIHPEVLEFVTARIQYNEGLTDVTTYINGFLQARHSLCWAAVDDGGDANPFNAQFPTGDYRCLEADLKKLLLLREDILMGIWGKWKVSLAHNQGLLSALYCKLLDQKDKHDRVVSLFNLRDDNRDHRICGLTPKKPSIQWEVLIDLGPEIDWQEVEAFAHLVRKNFVIESHPRPAAPESRPRPAPAHPFSFGTARHPFTTGR